MGHQHSTVQEYRSLLRAIVQESVAEPVEGGEGIEDFVRPVPSKQAFTWG